MIGSDIDESPGGIVQIREVIKDYQILAKLRIANAHGPQLLEQ
jgi:hypothetical protein